MFVQIHIFINYNYRIYTYIYISLHFRYFIHFYILCLIFHTFIKIPSLLMRTRLSFHSNKDAHNRKYIYQSIVYCWRSDITLVGIETRNFFYLSTGRYHLRSAQHFGGASGSFCFALSLQQPDMQHPPAASLALKNGMNLHLISLGMVEFVKSKDVLIPINSQ